MAKVLLVAPLHDPATAVSRWLGVRIARVLEQDGAQVRDGNTEVDDDNAAQTAHALRHLLQDRDGLLFCGHGDAHSMCLTRSFEWFELAHAGLLRDRWCHAICCEAGQALAKAVAEAGGTFAGYTPRLKPDFEPARLDDGTADRLTELAAIVTRDLHAGADVRHDETRPARLLRAHDDLINQLPATAPPFGFFVFASQLCDVELHRPREAQRGAVGTHDADALVKPVDGRGR